MEAVDLDENLYNNEHGYKRSGLEQTAGQAVNRRDAKSPRREIDMEEEEMVEEEDMTPYQLFGIYYKNWIFENGKYFKFEDPTGVPPMRHTYEPVLPIRAQPVDAMEIFFVKVAQIIGGLQWPLDVYGMVAVRDSLDRKRNYLFRRSREECQTLTSSEDSLLELTGPSRAVLLWGEPPFEIDLKLKGKEESEDKVLCCDVFGYNNLAYYGNASYTITEMVPSEHSAIEVKFAHVTDALEATITARITSGSDNFIARLTAQTASIGEDVVLLDTRGQKVSVTKDGEVVLQRRVVVVEEQGKLTLGIKAAQLSGNAQSSTTYEHKITYRARSALRCEGYFVIGSTRLQMMVAWSLLP